MIKLDRTLTYRLHLLHKLTDAMSQRAYVAGAGLSMSDGRCLAAVGTFAPLSVVDLAKKANLNNIEIIDDINITKFSSLS